MSGRLDAWIWLLLATSTFASKHNHHDRQNHHVHEHVVQHENQQIHQDIHRGLSVAGVRCRTPRLDEARMKEDYKSFVWSKMQDFHNEGESRELASIQVPTVFHIIANDEGEGLEAADYIESNVARLNSAFAIAGIEFYLVGEPVVTRNETLFPLTNLFEEKLYLSRQGGPETLNIYSGYEAYDDILGGFATYPRDYVDDELRDGVYVDYRVLLDLEDPTLPHEVGHWFDLIHTFGEFDPEYVFGYDSIRLGCDCIGDLVDDTPIQLTPSEGCPLGKDTCPEDEGSDPIFNFMDYSDCGREFTEGQAERMIWAWKTFRSPDADIGNAKIAVPDFASSPPASPCQPGDNGSNLIVDLTTDVYGYQTAWELRDSNNTIILSAALFQSLLIYTDGPYCLSPGDYKFTLYDRSGDGLDTSNNATAKYILFLDDEIIVSGDAYQCAESTTFTVFTSIDSTPATTEGSIIASTPIPTQFLVPTPVDHVTQHPSDAPTPAPTKIPALGSISGSVILLGPRTSPTLIPTQFLVPTPVDHVSQYPSDAPTPAPTKIPALGSISGSVILLGPRTSPTIDERAPLNKLCTSFPIEKTYLIIAKHSHLALNVAGSAWGDGANIVQWPVTSAQLRNDKWKLVPTSDGYYCVVSEVSGKALNVFQGLPAPGTNIVQWSISDVDLNDDWCFVDHNGGDGYYGMMNRLTGGVVEVMDASMVAGAIVQQGKDRGAANQSWKIVSVDDALTSIPDTPPSCAIIPVDRQYYIISKSSKMALNVADSALENGAKIVQWPISSQSTNEKWKLVPTSDGYYSIVSERSGKVLNVFRSSPFQGTDIIQWSISDMNTNDDWCFVEHGNGYYGILNRLTGGVVEVADASMVAGASIQQGKDIGADYQSWSIMGV